jgi:DNA polymerase III subunit alpha
MSSFVHLHNHTQYSLLDGASGIKQLMAKTEANGMQAVAITDHGNMFGVFEFVAEAHKKNIKPIIGCEFYVVKDRHQKQFIQGSKDKRYHQLLIAKDEEGYRNLTKLCSIGFTEGMYSKWPRIDKEVLVKYHKGLIATTCCIGAEIPQAILNQGEKEAESIFKWWLELFGDDYYVELQRHNLPEQDKVNKVLIELAFKYNVKMIASNDSHYIDESDASAHDILLCINTNDVRSTPIGDGKGHRFGFPNNQFFYKTPDEMKQVFQDLPEAIENTIEVADKVKSLKLQRDIMLPNFPIDPAFQIHSKPEFVVDVKGGMNELSPDVLNQWEYLKHLTFEGAKKRYQEISPEIEERLNFELFTIKTMGFAGYFLIVADFIQEGRNMGVFIGPGRGSAAGSAVAYCIGITNIDPIKYDLLFERFLNPERKSMPDIDTDFDDEGRRKVIDYVVQKYGRNQVAQIITYGTMAARSSIKDVARAMDLPLAEANYMAKLVPDKPGIHLGKTLNGKLEGLNPEEVEQVRKLQDILKQNNLAGEVLREAVKLEGSVRNTGVHAAGIIIAPEELSNIVPVAISKESDLLVTQFEGSIIENAGVIKMDFLGLKNLTIIKSTLEQVKKRYKLDLDPDMIPLDDLDTLELFKRADTVATFQFESPGMQKHLRDLKPDKFEDLIAMNALYRPGPIEYIPTYIKRKHGLEPIVYDLPELEEYLHETYGITVYQEQVMLLSQKLAGFSKGEADVLRKAMGKKDRATLDKLKPKFMEQASAKGLNVKKLEKIWTDWEAFASYAFNKSHSTCYAFVAFQTGYLKAHYPAEYMAAVLTHNLSDLNKVAFYIAECVRMGLKVLPPSVNESDQNFTATSQNTIRFGLAAIKGVGGGVVEAVLAERELNGVYTDIFDLCTRVQNRQLGKRVLESLASAGAFDDFEGIIREQYLEPYGPDQTSLLDRALKYGAQISSENASAQISLFGESSDASYVQAKPQPPVMEPWTLRRKLEAEKAVLGMYLSGHPLDKYKAFIKVAGMQSVSLVSDWIQGRQVVNFKVAGMITDFRVGTTKSDKKYLNFEVEDHSGAHKFSIFGETALKFMHLGNMPNPVVVVTGKTESHYYRPDSFEAKVLGISLMDTVMETAGNRLYIDLNINTVSAEDAAALTHILFRYPGTKDVFVKLLGGIDPEVGSEIPSVMMQLQATRVEMNPDLLNELEKHNFSFQLK